MTGYWRVRLKDATRHDFSRDAWNRNEVGIWYGAWSESDLAAAEQTAASPGDMAAYLSDIPAQRQLGWEVLPTDFVNTAKRFRDIPKDDWVVLYLASSQEIGLARVTGDMASNANHPLNSKNGELFKYRTIGDKKTFSLSRLPDAYRLVPTQGRGNVHQFNNMWEHVRLLADYADAAEVNRAFRAQPFDKLLDLLGASAWESFAFAYLILESEFIPTGLSTGRTLPIADIVGRRRSDGSRIVAQCKKHSSAQPIDPVFESVSAVLAPNDLAYYFAYGGCVGDVPKNICVIDRTVALQWAKTNNGRLYRDLIVRD